MKLRLTTKAILSTPLSLFFGSLIFFVLILQGSCDVVETNVLQSSPSIKFAKQKGTFKNEFLVDNRSDLALKVEEAWTENAWNYKDVFGKSIEVDSSVSYLYVRFKNDIDRSLNFSSVNAKGGIGKKRDRLVLVPNSNSINQIDIAAQKGSEEIDTLVLIKK